MDICSVRRKIASSCPLTYLTNDAADYMHSLAYLEFSDAVTQCKSHVGQLRSMLWIGYRYT